MKKIITSALFIALILSFSAGYLLSLNSQLGINSLFPHSPVSGPNEALPDFSSYQDVKQKKLDFFLFLLPKIQQANQHIVKERNWVKTLQKQNNDYSQTQMNRLLSLVEKYKIKVNKPNKIIQELLKRIDIIPASLVLAQAANESAWATSRFAKQGNNLFGQWCYVKGCGLIPGKRGSGQSHEVAQFKTVQESINSYMRNLNSQFSYEDLRLLRLNKRTHNNKISGYELAQGLIKYSTRRQAYVDEIQLMIKQNNLSQYDL